MKQKVQRNEIVIATWQFSGHREWGHSMPNTLDTCGSTKIELRTKRPSGTFATDHDNNVSNMFAWVWFNSNSVAIDLRCAEVQGDLSALKLMVKHLEELHRKVKRKFPLDGFVSAEPAEVLLQFFKAAGINDAIRYPARYDGSTESVYVPIEGVAIRIGEWIKEERKRFIREAA